MNKPFSDTVSWRTAVGLFCAITLAGCGQYGGLYLPEETAADQQAQDEALEQEEKEVSRPEEL